MILAEKLFNCFKGKDSFTLNEAYLENKEKPKTTVRARIYENLGIRFERKHMCWLDSKTKTFHTNPYCSGMKNAISIDYKEVDKTIWIPCKRCANKNIL